MVPTDLSDLIDFGRFPIDQPNSAALSNVIKTVADALDDDGCAVLRGFVKPEAVKALVEEADAVHHHGHRNFNRTNAYFTQDDPSLPETHPLRRFYDRSNSFVPADNFDATSKLRQLLEWPAFPEFVRQVLGEPKDKFFVYADPLADVIVNVAEEGNGFPWHFDTNNFTITLALQNAESGGEFDYCPNVRTATDECFDDVEAVLDDRHPGVKTLDLQPGDLQIFKGRYSLHRVRPLKGGTRRYVAIFSFVEKEGMVGSPERCKQLYGRVLPIHYERAGHRDDALVD